MIRTKLNNLFYLAIYLSVPVGFMVIIIGIPLLNQSEDVIGISWEDVIGFGWVFLAIVSFVLGWWETDLIEKLQPPKNAFWEELYSKVLHTVAPIPLFFHFLEVKKNNSINRVILKIHKRANLRLFYYLSFLAIPFLVLAFASTLFVGRLGFSICFCMMFVTYYVSISLALLDMIVNLDKEAIPKYIHIMIPFGLITYLGKAGKRPKSLTYWTMV